MTDQELEAFRAWVLNAHSAAELRSLMLPGLRKAVGA